MTTQNVFQHRWTFADIPVNTYYGPYQSGAGLAQGFGTTTAGAYVNMDGFDHLSIQFSIRCGADNTITVTVESDDGTTLTFVWDETLGSYESTTNTFNASYVQAGAGTMTKHLHLDDCNGRLFHIKMVVANAGVLDNEGIVTIRQTKV